MGWVVGIECAARRMRAVGVGLEGVGSIGAGSGEGVADVRRGCVARNERRESGRMLRSIMVVVEARGGCWCCG